MEHVEAKPCRFPIDGVGVGAVSMVQAKRGAFLSAPALLGPIVCVHRRIYMCSVP